jgi:hypothetical protein
MIQLSPETRPLHVQPWHRCLTAAEQARLRYLLMDEMRSFDAYAYGQHCWEHAHLQLLELKAACGRDPTAPDEDKGLDHWERAMRAELRRLGCDPHAEGREEGHPDNVFLTTLWEELCSLAGAGYGQEMLARSSREQYDYLQQHGYAAYWAWMEARDPEECGARWGFYLDNAGEPEYMHMSYALEEAETVLARLQALPDGAGAGALWQALADVPQAGE